MDGVAAAAAAPEPGEDDVGRFVSAFMANDFAVAEQEAQQIAARWPRHGLGWKALGSIRLARGLFAEALPLLEKAAEYMPTDAETWNKLGATLHQLGRLSAAEAGYRRAAALQEDFADAWYNCGLVLRDMGRAVEATDALLEAIKRNPRHAEALISLGLLCRERGLLSEAFAWLHRALALKRDSPEALANLASVLAEFGQPEEADAAFRRTLEIRPDWASTRSNHLFFLGYHGVRTGAEYLAEARQWELHAVPEQVRQAASQRRFTNATRAGRKLRVGYVSGDFRDHPVSRFVRPLLLGHDRSRLEVHAFSTNGVRDDVTADICHRVDYWHELAGLSDDEAVTLIGAYGIDVLIDLSGHTAGNRLGIFARRAAPVQCHYLGYFASTGLSQIDYWIGDAAATPLEHDAQHSETVWRLPRPWVAYEGPQNAPVPRWKPAGEGVIRLGSFNHLGKITERTIELWSKVLRRLKNGRLVLKTQGLGDAATQKRILSAFERHGVARDRVELVERTASWAEHMALYDGVDIALDPVGGHSGCTTTCEALWMGVPVVTRTAGRYAERTAAALLEALNFREWIAETDEVYVERVAALAADAQGRQELRKSLRRTLHDSQLCDARGLASALEDAYAAMFDRWVAQAHVIADQQWDAIPDEAQALNRRGIELVAAKRYGEGEASYRRATEIAPRYSVAHVNLGNALAALGRPKEAKAAFERGLELSPGWEEGRSSYLTFLSSSGAATPEEYVAQARKWELACVPADIRAQAKRKHFENPERRGRKLRVGYVSGDFNDHPVSAFMEPLIAQHDRSRVEIFAYSTVSKEDEVTERLKRQVDHWQSLAAVPDDRAVDLIGQQKIDVLVDLSGHTRNNRLGLFARRAAPVQCHYLGYFATTGLSEMDRFITDANVVPERLDELYSEKILRLPRVWVSYTLPPAIPEPAWLSRPDAAIVLGSFNHLGKVTERAIEVWATILGAIPRARLVLKTGELQDQANRERVEAAFARHGVSSAQLELLGRTADWAEHMTLYNRIDVALDPVGAAAGCTTTCEALAMGVPVITRAGYWHGDRQSAGILNAIGHGDWVTQQDDRYIETVVRLSVDVPLRRTLRQKLRDDMRHSELADTKGLAAMLEDEFERLFDLWLTGSLAERRDTESR